MTRYSRSYRTLLETLSRERPVLVHQSPHRPSWPRCPVCCLAPLLSPTGQPAAPVTVFAAASLTDSLKAVAEPIKAKTGDNVTLSFGASSTLARQIEQGAQADIFLSADTDWMDYLQKKGLIAKAAARICWATGWCWSPRADAKPAPRIAPHFDLAGALGDGRLAMADPASVPAGKYAKAALTALGVWDSVAAKVAQAENVRVALEYVARGEAPYGIVYATDAKIAPRSACRGHLSGEQPSAHRLSGGADQNRIARRAKRFWTFLSSAQARAIFEKAGFTLR